MAVHSCNLSILNLGRLQVPGQLEQHKIFSHKEKKLANQALVYLLALGSCGLDKDTAALFDCCFDSGNIKVIVTA